MAGENQYIKEYKCNRENMRSFCKNVRSSTHQQTYEIYKKNKIPLRYIRRSYTFEFALETLAGVFFPLFSQILVAKNMNRARLTDTPGFSCKQTLIHKRKEENTQQHDTQITTKT